MAPKMVSVLGADGWGAKFLLLARSFSGPVFPTLQRVKKRKKKKKEREWDDGGCRWHRGNYILIPAAEDLNCDTLFSSTWKGTCPLFFFPSAPAKSRRRHSVKERSDMQLITFSWSPSTAPTSRSTPPLTPLPFAFRPSVVTDFTMTW